MQKPQDHRESSNISSQMASPTAFETQKVEPPSKSSQPLLTTFKNVSLKTQQIITATTAGVISSLAVVATIQVCVHIIPQPVNMTQHRLEKTALAGLLTGFTVGGITFALTRITTERINIIINNLQINFNAVSRGDLTVRATVDSSKEFRQLAMSFNQMIQAIDTQRGDALRYAEKQENAKDVQDKLEKIVKRIEKKSQHNFIQAEAITSEYNQQDDTPQGTILEFLDRIRSLSNIPEVDLSLLGSSLEELQQRQDEVHYREAWLKALLDETQREMQLLSLIFETTDPTSVTENNDV